MYAVSKNILSNLEAGGPDGVAIICQAEAQHEPPLVVIQVLGTLLTPTHKHHG